MSQREGSALEPMSTDALVRMESVEQAARIVAVAGLRGRAQGVLRRDDAALASLRRAHEFHREAFPRPS